MPDGNNINSWDISSGISSEDGRLLFSVADSFQRRFRYTYFFGEGFCFGVSVGFAWSFPPSPPSFAFFWVGGWGGDRFEQPPIFHPSSGGAALSTLAFREPTAPPSIPPVNRTGQREESRGGPATPPGPAHSPHGGACGSAGVPRGFRAAGPPRPRAGAGAGAAGPGPGRGGGPAEGAPLRSPPVRPLLPLTGALPAPLRHFVGGAERRPRARGEPRSSPPRAPPASHRGARPPPPREEEDAREGKGLAGRDFPPVSDTPPRPFRSASPQSHRGNRPAP